MQGVPQTVATGRVPWIPNVDSESVSHALQRDSQGVKAMVSMEGVRALFDGLIDKFAQRDQVSVSLTLSLSQPLIQAIGSHIKPDSDVVHSPDFENGIVKIQGGVEDALTDAEKRAVKGFLIEDEQIEDEDAQSEDLGFADQLLASSSSRKRARARAMTSAYRDTRHVHPTTNALERLFSRCKLNMTALRKKMDPDSLDMLMFLKANKELWPDAKAVQRLLDSLTPDDWANADVGDEEEDSLEE